MTRRDNALRVFLACCALWASINYVSAKQSDTPLVYTYSEQELGQHWLRAFRSHVKTSSEPLLIDYTDKLLQRLSSESQSNFGDLSLVLVDNQNLNAFAVPGGIIGIHTGIFSYAKNEAQLASILAHELAHLSQRHSFRSQQQAKQQQFSLYASLLASILLASAGEGEASMAALSASRAASIQTQLRFSRAHESEADLEGLKLLSRAGYDPLQMIDMLELLKKSLGVSGNNLPPEYLLTHPLPNQRLISIKQRIFQISQRAQLKTNSLGFMLMKAMLEYNHHETPIQAVKHHLAQNTKQRTELSQFSLANAYYHARQYRKAEKLLRTLHAKTPTQAVYTYLLAKTLNKQNHSEQAKRILEKHLIKEPNSYPLNIALASTLSRLKEYTAAQQILFQLLNQHKNQPLVWYLLAKVSGQKQDNIQMHEARAEQLILLNQFKNAEKQLRYALEEKTISRAQTLSINSRLDWIKSTQLRYKELGF